MDTILYMFGDYATTAMPETLAMKKYKDSTKASGDIARLNECRLLNISEPSQKMVLDSALLKTLLGRDKITARHLNKSEFEFYPKFKLFMNCNHLPIIDDDTVFASGRINVITFDKHFKEHEQDKELKDKLKAENEISGIFNWCLEGLEKYDKEKCLKTPKEIEIATAEYEIKNDKIAIFVKKELVKSDTNVTFADVFKRYCKWCEDNNIASFGKKELKAKLKRMGIFKDRATVNGKNKTKCNYGLQTKINRMYKMYKK